MRQLRGERMLFTHINNQNKWLLRALLLTYCVFVVILIQHSIFVYAIHKRGDTDNVTVKIRCEVKRFYGNTARNQ